MKKIPLVLFAFWGLAQITACDQHNHHETEILYATPKLPIFCDSLSSAQLLLSEAVDFSGKPLLLSSGDKTKESLGTLCNAVVERKFPASCDRADQFGLEDPRFRLEILHRHEEHKTRIYFGAKTPDGFGQYIALSHSGDESTIRSPCVDIRKFPGGKFSVLVVPAYHSKQFETSIRKK